MTTNHPSLAIAGAAIGAGSSETRQMHGDIVGKMARAGASRFPLNPMKIDTHREYLGNNHHKAAIIDAAAKGLMHHSHCTDENAAENYLFFPTRAEAESDAADRTGFDEASGAEWTFEAGSVALDDLGLFVDENGDTVTVRNLSVEEHEDAGLASGIEVQADVTINCVTQPLFFQALEYTDSFDSAKFVVGSDAGVNEDAAIALLAAAGIPYDYDDDKNEFNPPQGILTDWLLANSDVIERVREAIHEEIEGMDV